MSHISNWQNSRRWFGTAVIILGAFLLVQYLSPAAQATTAFPGYNGKIAFIRNHDIGEPGGGEGSYIYVMNADGSGQQNLTTDLYPYWNNKAPAWSPDTTKIAFAGVNGSSGPNIYVMNADGTDRQQLTFSEDTGSPKWSLYGTKIAFEKSHDQLNDIFVMNADGSDVKQLTTDYNIINYTWSPNGAKIAFTTISHDIYVMNADGSNQQQLSEDANSPNWSPDGTKIAYDHDGNIYIMNTDGSDQQQLTLNNGQNGGPVWSPDGMKIAFVNTDNNAYTNIFIINPDGSDQQQLSNSGDAHSPNWEPIPLSAPLAPTSLEDRYDVTMNNSLYIGAPGVLANDFSANGSPHVYYLDADTKHLHELAWVNDQWNDTDLTTATGAPTFSTLHGLTSTTVNGEPRVYYHAGWYIYEMAWFSNAWHYRNLTPDVNWLSAPSGSIKATTVNGDPRVYYLANDQHIHELAWFNDSWHYRDVTAVVDGPEAAADSTIAVTTITNSDPRVYYMAESSDGMHIHELAWYEKVWHHRDITADVGAPLPVDNRMLAATTVGFLPRVYYETSNIAGPAEELHELAWNPPDEWQDNYLMTHGGLSLAASSLSAMTSMHDVPRVYYAETVIFDPEIPGHIYEVDGAEGVWSHHELGEFQNSDGNENSLAVTTARLDPRVYYVDGNHHVREFALVNDEWSGRDITADVNGPNASGYILSATTVGSGYLTAILVNDVAHGELTLYPDGSFLYEPNEGYIGEDSFTYVVNDGNSDSSAVTVELRVYDPCAQDPSNLVANFCFADGIVDWEFWHDEYQGSYAVSTNDPNVGQYSAEITIDAPGSNVQFYQNGIVLQPDTTYNLSFAARSKDGQDMSITMHKNTDPFKNYGLSGHHVDLKPYWKLFDVTFTTPNIPEMNDARLRFSPYVQNGTVYYIDKVELRSVSNP